MLATGAAPASIPSPARGVWYLGPLPVRAYALFILAGIFVAVWLTTKRWTARGGDPETVSEVAMWAVPFGIVGGRLYHVISSPDAYFGAGGDPGRVIRIWEGGLGIWGAIALGAVGAYIGTRRAGVRFAPLADAAAPGIVFAQAIGRLGNYFNQELFGRPTDLPWALEIDLVHRPMGYEQFTAFHPTFLYELLWNVAVGVLLLYLDRRYRLGHGQVFWAYVALYTLGRVWIEALRIDDAELVFGLRLNIWTSIVVFTLAAVMFRRSRRRHGGGRQPVAPRGGTTATPPAELAESDAGDRTPNGAGTEAATDTGPGRD
ncbi:MAG: prolipoprotein diacylglyceryl transferase [Micrococcales bacterium]|nr:MAG: prolipoprotein diacylglyceryl transferase [Micrococcales bacterium]